MKQIYILLVAILATTFSYGQIFINEIDADTPGTDEAEFIELKGAANTSLDGYVVVLFNGSSDTSYDAYDLDGKSLDANGFFILANTALATGSDIDMGASNKLQNGADAVALYQASDTDFPTGTAATTTNLISAIVYDTDDNDDSGLLIGLGETVQYNEKENANANTESIQRKIDGTYETKPHSFRQENDAPTCELSLGDRSGTCDAETTNIDTYTANIAFSGGSTATYTITASSGTVSGDNPNSVETGIIIVTSINEEVDLVLNITSELCNLEATVTGPTCYPATSGTPVITGIVDGTLASDGCDGTSGSSNPRFIEIYVNGTVNFTDYKMENESNGAVDTAGESWYATNLSGFGVRTDETIFLVTAGEVTFTEMYPNANYITGGSQGNGNDSYRILDPADAVIDQFGTPTDVTGSGDHSAAWDYEDSYARRNSTSTANGGAFNVTNWTIGADNEFDAPNNTCAYISGSFPLSTTQQTIENFVLYPNPVTNGILTITTKNNQYKNIQIFDILGKQVLTEMITGSTINVSKLNAGIYLIKVEEAGNTATSKLVIR